MAENVTKLTFLLLPDFSMMSVTSALEPLRGANRLLGYAAYEWQLISTDGASVCASNGMEIHVSGMLGADEPTDFLFVCAGLNADPPQRSRINTALQRAVRAGVIIGSLSAGTFVLARAGLLNGYDCTVHWEFQPAFEEEFPDIPLSSGLFVIDRDRWTGSGGITGMDMMLQMIERDHGPDLARSIGNQFQIDRIRNAAIHQRPGQIGRLETLPDALRSAIELMQAHIEIPLGMGEIATASGMNIRRMERLFNAHLGASPARFYRSIRLEKARDLLLHSNLSTLEVACLTGFSSSSHFAMAYQRQYGMRPTETRKKDAHDPITNK